MLPGVMAAARLEEATPRLKGLKKACDGIEASFLKQMLGAMHRAAEEAKPLGDDTGADTYRDMMDNALADRLASRGAIGISKLTLHATARQVMSEVPKGQAPKPKDPTT